MTNEHSYDSAVLFAEDPLDQTIGDSAIVHDQRATSPWNGRTSIGRVMTLAAFRAHSSAASRSGALTIKNPPICSFPSVKGPSVMSTSSPFTRTTVAVVGGCSPPLNTHTPADLISSTSARTSRITLSRTSGGGVGPSG